jgi:NIPSNAP
MIYELRTYRCSGGRLKDLLARFEAPVLLIWRELNIRNVGFWTSEGSIDGKSVDELVYLLRWDSDEERKTKMGSFLKDPRWIEARDKSEANGKLIESFASKDLHPASFSEMK